MRLDKGGGGAKVVLTARGCDSPKNTVSREMPPSLIYPLQCIVSDVDFEFGEVAEIMTMRIDSVVYGNILNLKSSDSGSVLSASFLVGLLGIQFSVSLPDFIAAMHSRPL